MSSLADQQAALVAALVGAAPPPPGFDPHRLRAARGALLRKRAGEVAAAWPLLAASLGAQWSVEFGRWAHGRPPAGSLRDGWDFALTRVALTAPAADELALRRARWLYDGERAPRPRRAPALRRGGTLLAVQFGGRVWQVRWARRS